MGGFLLFACVFVVNGSGCGGLVARDTFESDATGDGSTHSDGGTDSSFTSDSIGPPSDVALPDAPTACAALSDPCFAQFAAQVEKAAICMAHPDTCAESGGTDASGCGHRSPNPTGGTICTWPDGASLTETSTSANALNASDFLCYTYVVRSVAAKVYDVTITFPEGPDGSWVEELTDPGTPEETIVIECPDGAKSRTFSQAEIDACNIATVCCSNDTPPTCK